VHHPPIEPHPRISVWRKSSPGCALWGLIGTLAALLPAGAQAGEAERLREVQAQIHALEQRLEQDHEQLDSVERELRDTEQEIGAAGRRLYEHAKDRQRQQQTLVRLTRRRDRLRSSLARQREALARQLRANYAVGHRDALRLLLEQDRTERLQRVLGYYESFTRTRSNQIQQLNSSLQALRQTEASTSEAIRRLAQLETYAARESARLQQGRARRQALTEALEARIRNQTERLLDLERDAQHLNEVLNSLRNAIDTNLPPSPPRTPFVDQKGQLPWPSPGQILVSFDTPRQPGTLRWSGVVIDSDPGQQVRAISGGQVIFAGWLRGFGLVAILEHGDGYMSLYGYNESLYADPGDWVEGGEVIGSVGTQATPSQGQRPGGLYFEIRHLGQALDPADWCVSTAPDKVGKVAPGSGSLASGVGATYGQPLASVPSTRVQFAIKLP